MSVAALSFDNVVEVVSVISDAFRDYPVMRWVAGADTPAHGAPYEVRLHRLVQLFVSARAYRDEPMMGVRDERGALIAAAVMSYAPTADPPPTFIALRESIWAELGADARGRADAYGDASAFFDALGTHHHLNMIGVRRTHQGLGLGRELLEAVQKLAAADPRSTGVSLTTELPQNVKLYEHFGYRVVGHKRVGPGLETWGMFRDRS
jgi:GNAT superfamily N-acetyltransferase